MSELERVCTFGEILSERLDMIIGKSLPSGLTLKGWRYDLHDLSLLEVGLKNSRLGGPYTAPSMKSVTEGDIFLIWEDKSGDRAYTSGKIDLSTLDEFESNLELWEKTSFKDQFGADLVDPYEPPLIHLAQEEVKKIVEGDFTYPFALLEKGEARLRREYGVSKVDGRVKIVVDHRLVANSKGLWVAYEQTPVNVFLEGEDIFGDSFGEKRLPTNEEYDSLIRYTGETIEQLKKEAESPGEGEMYILLPPKVFGAFLEHYLLSNLSGGLVANRQSAFSREDFADRQQVFRKDFSVRVDGTRPYRYNSYRCTGEGVPTGQIEYIKEGRLITPILNMKYAKRIGMLPTPVPIGGAQGLIVDANRQRDLGDVFRNIGEILIVHSILGLHTQDYTSGKFSLTADQCLLVRNGEITGKVQTVIAGDFLGALKAEDTVYAEYPYHELPACSFKAFVAHTRTNSCA